MTETPGNPLDNWNLGAHDWAMTTSTARRRLVGYILSFRDPDSGELLPEWTDLATGRTIEGGIFTRYVEAVEAGRPFVNWHVDRIVFPDKEGLT